MRPTQSQALRELSEYIGRLRYDMEHRPGAYIYADKLAIQAINSYRPLLDHLSKKLAPRRAGDNNG